MAAFWDMATRSANATDVVPDILHHLYPQIAWSAADMVATPHINLLRGLQLTIVCTLS